MYFIVPLASLKNPFIKLNTYKKNRAMDPMTDIKDWLGGYPYEVATFDEIVTFLNEINQNFKLVSLSRILGAFLTAVFAVYLSYFGIYYAIIGWSFGVFSVLVYWKFLSEKKIFNKTQKFDV